MHGIDLKNAAVHMYKHCTFSLRQVVSMLGNRFSKSSLQRWIQGHPATKRLFAPRSKVTSQVQDALDSYISSNPFATSQDVSDHLVKELNVSLSPSTVRCWRKKIGFTRKRTYARAPDTEAVKQHQKEYVMKAMDLDIDDVISVDETCVYFDIPARSGYSRKGTRLHIPLSRHRRKKYTLILAVGTMGVIHWQLLEGSANTSTFQSFVSSVPIPESMSKPTILMDNVAFHKSRAVVKAASDRNLTIVYTPPYSPQYNPVEMAFSVAKSQYRKLRPDEQPDNLATVTNRVEHSMHSLAPHKVRHMFEHCWQLVNSFT
jgi:transposase